jgi:hypothetical protein
MINADIGTSTSNSYLTLDEVNEYFATRSYSSEWDSITDKEQFIISATNQIDWFFEFNGERISDTQALQFPRQNCYDYKLDKFVAVDEIPQKIKYAVCELILASLSEDRFQESDLAGLQEVQVGSLRVKANSAGAWQDKKQPIPEIVYQILSGLSKATVNSMFSRVVRF